MKIFIVDSFTDSMFKGNPAAVCLLEKKTVTAIQMQAVAREMNLSETAFISDKNGEFHIRYFSPKMEIPLCGHATLAASKVMFEEIRDTQLTFHTIQDLKLIVSKKNSLLEMEVPAYKTTAVAANPVLLKALGISNHVNCEYNNETKILLIEVENANIIRQLRPDFQSLIKAHQSINGVLVTSQYDTPEYDFCSRYFWPWSGTNEDPVTGGTHTFLAEYWSKRLRKKVMKSFQCSDRTGHMEVELTENNTVLIRGKAVKVLEGFFDVCAQ